MWSKRLRTITELKVQGGLPIRAGHVGAYEDSLEYSVGKAGGSWIILIS